MRQAYHSGGPVRSVRAGAVVAVRVFATPCVDLLAHRVAARGMARADPQRAARSSARAQILNLRADRSTAGRSAAQAGPEHGAPAAASRLATAS
jgi:hypothetical protein